jgi:uncharacterized damage-inducible protein DinB
MQVADLRFLFSYDRWATRRILASLPGLADGEWSAPSAWGGRGVAALLVHMLGAHQTWRHGLAGTGVSPDFGEAARPSIAEVTAAWEAEFTATEAWLVTLDDAWLLREDDGVPYWQLLAHVANHSTQHRSEAAAILTASGRSPGDLDMLDYADELARA